MTLPKLAVSFKLTKETPQKNLWLDPSYSSDIIYGC